MMAISTTRGYKCGLQTRITAPQVARVERITGMRTAVSTTVATPKHGETGSQMDQKVKGASRHTARGTQLFFRIDPRTPGFHAQTVDLAGGHSRDSRPRIFGFGFLSFGVLEFTNTRRQYK
jgi:hypothetical protein